MMQTDVGLHWLTIRTVVVCQNRGMDSLLERACELDHPSGESDALHDIHCTHHWLCLRPVTKTRSGDVMQTFKDREKKTFGLARPKVTIQNVTIQA